MQIIKYGLIEKAASLNDGEVEFIVSTNDWDAHGERMNVDGINFKDFKKNPVVLWSHEGYSLPIAKATKIWKDGKKLMAKAMFDLEDKFAAEVYRKLKDGFLNAVSIGGMVEEWGSDGLTISKLNMKEFSVVSIPANPKALATAKSLDTQEQQEVDKLEKMFKQRVVKDLTDADRLVKSVDKLETLVATLKEVAEGETNEDQAKNLRVVLRQAQAVDKQAEQVIKTIKVELKGNSNE